MAGETLANVGSGVSNLGSGFANIIGGIENLVGSSTKGKTRQTGSSSTTATQSGETRRGLELDNAAIEKVIRDVLGADDGLAAIFAGEQVSGLYNTTAAAQAAGDLVTRLVGEIAKLTAEEFTTVDQEQTQTTDQELRSQTEQKDKGVLGSIGDKLGF